MTRYVSMKLAVLKQYLDNTVQTIQQTWDAWFSDVLPTGVRSTWATWFGARQIAQQEQAQQLQLGLMTGKYSENPQKVMLYSAPQPCGCPCGS